MFGWRWVVAPLRLRLTDLDLAELVERQAAGGRSRIADVLQLADLLATPQFASAELVGAAISEHAQMLDRFDYQSLIDADRSRRSRILRSRLNSCALVVCSDVAAGSRDLGAALAVGR